MVRPARHRFEGGPNETGLYYYRARYYDADLGRFLQVDPVGYADQWNLYAYVGNNPLNATDPTGMFQDGRAERAEEQNCGVSSTSMIADLSTMGVRVIEGATSTRAPGSAALGPVSDILMVASEYAEMQAEVAGGANPAAATLDATLETGINFAGAISGGAAGAEVGARGGPVGILIGSATGFTLGGMAAQNVNVDSPYIIGEMADRAAGVNNAIVNAASDALPPEYEGPIATLYRNVVGQNQMMNVSDNDRHRGVFGN